MLALDPEPPVEPVVPAPPAVLPLLVDPVEPAVDPLVEPEPEPEADELPEPLDMLAFVRMNDAPFPLPDVERDALVPDVELPPVDPVVPVAPPMSPDCRQPVTVIVPLCPDRLEPLCCDPEVWLLPLCAATIAVHPTPIANIHAARFIRPPPRIEFGTYGCKLFAITHPLELWRRPNGYSESANRRECRDVRATDQTCDPHQTYSRGRRREAAACLRLRRHHRLRSIFVTRRFPQRTSRRLQGRLSVASAPRHRDDHVCPRRNGRARRQPRQPRQPRCWRRAVDDRGPRHPAPGDAAGGSARAHARVSAVGEPSLVAEDDGAALSGRARRRYSRGDRRRRDARAGNLRRVLGTERSSGRRRRRSAVP